jgi:hypothetical protein
MPNSTLAAGAPQKSVVADFEESVPQLWDALTDGEDLQGRWHKHTFSDDVTAHPPGIDFTNLHFGQKHLTTSLV